MGYLAAKSQKWLVIARNPVRKSYSVKHLIFLQYLAKKLDIYHTVECHFSEIFSLQNSELCGFAFESGYNHNMRSMKPLMLKSIFGTFVPKAVKIFMDVHVNFMNIHNIQHFCESQLLNFCSG